MGQGWSFARNSLTNKGVHELGGVESQGITRMRQAMLARLMETQTWGQPVSTGWGGEGSKEQWSLPALPPVPVSSVGGGPNNETITHASTSIPERAPPPVLALNQTIQFFLCPWHFLSYRYFTGI